MNDLANFLNFDTADATTRSGHCEAHGEFVSRNLFRTIWSRCPECAAERSREHEAEKAEKARVERQREWEVKIGRACIPERFRTRTLASYVAETDKQREALSFAKEYAANFESGCQSAVFVGLPGTGKTHLAVGIALEVMEKHRSALFTTTMRAIRSVKETWSRDSEKSERQAISALVFPDLLILDEVGVQFGSDTEKLILFDVLNERYEQCKATLLLSNLSVAEVRDYLGDRIFDRLREDGGRCIVFDWPSHRGQA